MRPPRGVGEPRNRPPEGVNVPWRTRQQRNRPSVPLFRAVQPRTTARWEPLPGWMPSSALSSTRHWSTCTSLDCWKLMPVGDCSQWGTHDVGGQIRLRYHHEIGMGQSARDPSLTRFEDTNFDFLLTRLRLYENWDNCSKDVRFSRYASVLDAAKDKINEYYNRSAKSDAYTFCMSTSCYDCV